MGARKASWVVVVMNTGDGTVSVVGSKYGRPFTTPQGADLAAGRHTDVEAGVHASAHRVETDRTDPGAV